MSTDFLTEPTVEQEASATSQVVLVAFVMLLGAALGWFGPRIHRSLSEDMAVAALRELGGIVRYGYQLSDEGKFLPDTEPPGPAWLRSIVGDSYFARVADVDLSLTYLKPPYLDPGKIDEDSIDRLERLSKFGDAEMALIAQFHELKELRLGDTQVTGRGLVHLRRLNRLKTLRLEGTRVEDSGLMHVAHLTNLKQLYLSRTLVSDDGLEYLARLVNLEELYVGETKVSEAGLFALGKVLPDCTVDSAPQTFDDEQ